MIFSNLLINRIVSVGFAWIFISLSLTNLIKMFIGDSSATVVAACLSACFNSSLGVSTVDELLLLTWLAKEFDVEFVGLTEDDSMLLLLLSESLEATALVSCEVELISPGVNRVPSSRFSTSACSTISSTISFRLSIENEGSRLLVCKLGEDCLELGFVDPLAFKVELFITVVVAVTELPPF